MSVLFYLDGNQVGIAKAKVIYQEACKHFVGVNFTQQELDTFWKTKATSELSRDRIQELTCLDSGNLEVIIEED